MSTAPTTEQSMLEREEDEPVIEEGFTPVSNVTVMKKNGRYIAVAVKNIKPNELIEKTGFVVAPYKSNEPDQRSKQLANILPVLPCSCSTCKIVGPSLVIPSGNLIFMQFSQKPNTDIKFDTNNATIEIRSNERIHKGDEIFVNYASLYPQSELQQESMFTEEPFNANV
tara:strand:- start:95 stop:601 length:507 start_codon:yes stop_codon:yes gene_type:complete